MDYRNRSHNSWYDSEAYEASAVVTTQAAILRKVSGYNSKASAQFIQVHDAAAVPSDTAVPKIFFTVPASSNFTWDVPSGMGKLFPNGIVVCNSSTGPTKTVGSADCWFNVSHDKPA